MPELSQIFGLSVHPLEMVVRGTAVYWFLFLLLRFVLRRDVSSIGIADVLLLVLLADAAQNAMAGEYKTVTDGCILVSTIAGWNYLIDWLGFHSPAFRRFVEPAPVLLVRDGQLQRRNMRRELVTLEELKSQMRDQGIEKLEEIRLAHMESDGEISFIQRKPDEGAPKKKRRKAI